MDFSDLLPGQSKHIDLSYKGALKKCGVCGSTDTYIKQGVRFCTQCGNRVY